MLFVSLIGFCFLIEICMVKIDWGAAATGWVKPVFPSHAMPVIMSVLGAVVMPHNLFFTFGDHSEPEVESERRSGDSETIEI